jgi:HTH-type transcriptional regulator/antitoxin MqsA
MNMKCPVCGAAELIHDTRDQPYTYKGETTVIAAVTGDFCPACAESILDAAESNRVMREMRAFSKQVNAAIVDPAFITNVRKKLDLDQREAAEIFGGGSMPSRATRTARPSRRWPWSSCSRCWIATPTCSTKSERHNQPGPGAASPLFADRGHPEKVVGLGL